MLKKIVFSGGFFGDNAELELFDKSDKLQPIYGKNGSGKSSITKAILKAKGKEVSDIDNAELFDENGDVLVDLDNVFVFNEDYVNEKVKICKDGIDTIVLLGDLAGIDDKIDEVNKRISKITTDYEKQNEILKKYTKSDSPESPEYFLKQVDKKLSGDGFWADRERQINNNKNKSRVTETIKKAIQAAKPSSNEQRLRDLFNEKLDFLNKVRGEEAEELVIPSGINVNVNITDITKILEMSIEKPILSDREKYLLTLLDEGKYAQINEMKKNFMDE